MNTRSEQQQPIQSSLLNSLLQNGKNMESVGELIMPPSTADVKVDRDFRNPSQAVELPSTSLSLSRPTKSVYRGAAAQ